jgi:hypothetical protein
MATVKLQQMMKKKDQTDKTSRLRTLLIQQYINSYGNKAYPMINNFIKKEVNEFIENNDVNKNVGDKIFKLERKLKYVVRIFKRAQIVITLIEQIVMIINIITNIKINQKVMIIIIPFVERALKIRAVLRLIRINGQ